MTRILFGLSLFLATCLLDGYGLTVAKADAFDTPSIVGIDADGSDSLSDDPQPSALFDAPELPASPYSQPSPPHYHPQYSVDIRRSYQIRAPPVF